MAKAKEEFDRMEQEKDDLMQRVEDSQSQEKTSKLLRSVLLIVVGLVLIVAIAYWAFVIPARQSGEGEPAPAEES
jgi:CHASE3 domain sensor protein